MPPPVKKRKTQAVEEITFDTTDRQDFLTGFHKRKLQRAKHAQNVATKREREERIEARKHVGHSQALILTLSLTLDI